MRVAGLELSNFRSWAALGIDLAPRRTAFVGPNASGKTSILEAIWFTATLGSHRASAESVMVRAGERSGVVRVRAEREGREELVELELVAEGRARTRLAGAPVARRRNVLGVVRAALFAPERLAIVRGDPGERRRFVDEILVQLHPRYDAVIREYERALRQRNALLREAGGQAPPGLEAWDEAVAGPGGELCAGRAAALAALSPAATGAFGAVGGSGDLAVRYTPNVRVEGDAEPASWTEAIRARLAERRRDELVRGVTLAGPHRDDVEITIGGLPSRTHASQGEAWITAIALVLAARSSIAAQVGEEPVLLLDDAFSLLDPGRRERLAASLPAEIQVLATASDPGEIPSAVPWTIRAVSREGVGAGG